LSPQLFTAQPSMGIQLKFTSYNALNKLQQSATPTKPIEEITPIFVLYTLTCHNSFNFPQIQGACFNWLLNHRILIHRTFPIERYTNLETNQKNSKFLHYEHSFLIMDSTHSWSWIPNVAIPQRNNHIRKVLMLSERHRHPHNDRNTQGNCILYYHHRSRILITCWGYLQAQ